MEEENFIIRNSNIEKDNDFFIEQNLLDRMNGWFSPASHAIFSIFLKYQIQNKIKGNLCEIGVWEGKSASIICKNAQELEKIFLVDPLLNKYTESVMRNIDNICRTIPNNLVMCNIESDNLFSIGEMRKLFHSFRFIHIDGCHTGSNIYSDLVTAEKLLTNDGIVVVDDYFNISYTQITEALYKYLYINPYSFRIFCVGFNKAYLCRPNVYSKYYSFCMSALQLELLKKQIAVTIKKTSGIGDCYTISIEGFNKLTDPMNGFRGPDWEPTNIDYIEKK